MLVKLKYLRLVFSSFAFAFLLTPICQATDLNIINQNQYNVSYKTSTPSSAQISSILALLDSTGKFTDLDYTYTEHNQGGKVKPHLDRLTSLSKAWSDTNSNVFKESELRNTIFLSLSKWISLDLNDLNWWHRTIGWPQALIPTAVLLKSELKTNNPNLYNKVYEYLIQSSSFPGMYGANATDVAQITLAAATFKDSLALAQKVINEISPEFLPKSGSSEGYYPDYSFNQHNGTGRQLYYGGYGNVFYTGFYKLQSVVQNSSFQFSNTIKNHMIQLMLDGFGSTVYNQYADLFTFGRGIVRSKQPLSSKYLTPIQYLLDLNIASNTQTRQLQDLYDRIKYGNTEINYASFNRTFPHADFIVHQRKHWYSSVRGVSTRTVGNESGNGEGLKNYHLADGANFVFHSGNEYGQIYPVWNWKRIPGTTVEQLGGTLPLNKWGAGGNGKNTLAGGVSDGNYGVYALDFKKGSIDSNVTAKKSWFFFDDELVALGAGIQASNANRDVYTSVEQSLYKGPIQFGQGAFESTLNFQETKYFSKPFWAYHNSIGYVFHQVSKSATLNSKEQSGRFSDLSDKMDTSLIKESVFNIWMNHGKNVSDGFYAYSIIPGQSYNDFVNYTQNNPIKILVNSDTLQSIFHKNLNKVGAVFYKAGKLNLPQGAQITTSASAQLLIDILGDSIKITAATGKYKSLNLEMSISNSWSGTGVVYDSASHKSTWTINLPGGDSVGQSRSITLTQNSPPCIPVRSSSDDGNVAENLLDNDLSTRWSSLGVGEWIELCFEDVIEISGFNMSFYKGDERTSQFSVLKSQNGFNYDTLVTEIQSSGSNLNLEKFTLPSPTNLKFLKLIGKGNSSNNWNSWTEITIDTLETDSIFLITPENTYPNTELSLQKTTPYLYQIMGSYTQISLTNIKGESLRISPTQGTINLSHLASGSYYLTIQNSFRKRNYLINR